MKNPEKVWIGATVLFLLSFVVTFLVDYLGIIETGNLGYVEELWISWMLFTAGIGLTLVILTRFIVKE
jgi:choline-glycine betaine transporter